MTRDNPLIDLAYRMTSADITSKEEHARRAFELAHHARRLLERAAETASRDRWPILERSGYQPETQIARYAQRCANAVIKYPVHGEARVYAALLDAVDKALLLSEALYKDWLATQPRVEPLPEASGVNRLGAPLAPGCARTEPRLEDE